MCGMRILAYQSDLFLHPTFSLLITSLTNGNLETLGLGNTLVQGTIFDFIVTWPNAEQLRFEATTFLVGTIPSTWLNTNLRHLALDGVSLTGTLPTELGLLTQLTTLSVGSESVDAFLSGAGQEEELVVATNNQRRRLEGTLPSELGNLENLSKWPCSVIACLSMLYRMRYMPLFSEDFVVLTPKPTLPNDSRRASGIVFKHPRNTAHELGSLDQSPNAHYFQHRFEWNYPRRLCKHFAVRGLFHVWKRRGWDGSRVDCRFAPIV